MENGGIRGKSGKNIIMNKEYAKSNPIGVDDFKILDLTKRIPNAKGFSANNLWYVESFYK